MSFLLLQNIGPAQVLYVSAVGRAMTICQHFESCVQHVMVVWGITDEIRDDIGDLESHRALARQLSKLSLGRGVGRLEQADDFGAEHAAVLHRGRLARNWFAHESLNYVELALQPSRIREMLDGYRSNLRTLCEADSLASRASYEIAEREPTPIEFLEHYGTDLFQWGMEPILSLVGTLAGDGR